MRASLALVAVALVSACAVQPAAPPAGVARAPVDFPEAYYLEAARQGKTVYRVDPAASLIAIEVKRGGSLARLGHDHVIASHDVEGFVAPHEGRADFFIRLDQLVVDEPALRAQAHFDTQPSAEDIAGTRRNMLGALQADSFPFARIAVVGAGADSGSRPMRTVISVHGTTREFAIPVRIDAAGKALIVTGALAVRQSDFGVTPLSVLGGAIQVQDEVNLRFHITARDGLKRGTPD